MFHVASTARLLAACGLGVGLAACSERAPTTPAAAPQVGVAGAVVSAGPAAGTRPAAGPPLSPAGETAAAPEIRPTGAPAPAPRPSARYAASTVLGKKDRVTPSGTRVCNVAFVYAGREPEDLFWEEPCADVTVRMVDRALLEKYRRWERLDAFERRFVEAMPAGKVLYVEGASSAAVYPIDTTGTSIEVFVAD